MAGVKISALPAVVSALTTDFFPVVQGGVTSRETLSQVQTLFGFTAGVLDVTHGGTGLSSTTINQLLYSPANNVIAGLPTGVSGTLITSAGGVPSISQTLPTTVQSNITQLGAQSQALNMNSHFINNLLDPVQPQDAATKAYTDAVATGLNILAAAYAATTATLTATYANGASGVGATLTNSGALAAFTVDSVSPPINSRILVKNQASTFQNGVYTLTTVGSGAIAWVLTRATDYDQVAEINPGDFILVNFGTVNTATGWVETATVVTIGTDPILFSQFGMSFPVSLANGGTGASLTASNGGIFYSTASAGAILAGTATARQMLQSGASSAPAWSTSTWPATTTINQILYSSAANVVSEITTGASRFLTTNASGVPSFTNTYVNGTFTPTFTGSGASPTSLTYSAQTGKYTQIGNVVYYFARVILSAITMGAAAGDLRINGLPSSSAGGADVAGNVILRNIAFTANPSAFIINGVNYVNIISSVSGGGATVLAVTALTATTDIVVTGFYYTA